MDASKFEPDKDVVEDRRPTNCPFCGSETAFDGQGRHSKTVTVKQNGKTKRINTNWYRNRCPECNGHFEMLETAGEL